MNTSNAAPSAPDIPTEVRRTFQVEGNAVGIRTQILGLLGRTLEDQRTVRAKEGIVTITFPDSASEANNTEFLLSYQFNGGARLVPYVPKQ